MNVKDAAKKAKDKSTDLYERAKTKTDEILHEDKFILESLEDPQRITAYLHTVIDGIEKGRIVLTGEDRELVLYPGSLVKFSIKGKRSTHKGKLSIKLSWSRLAEDTVGQRLTLPNAD